MGRTIVWTWLTVLFFALVEAAILSNLSILPVVPDLVLLVIVYVSFMNNSATGSTIGFVSGLFLDFFSAAPIGLNAFIKTVTGFLAGKLSGSFNLNKLLIPFTMGFAATVLKALLMFLLSLFFRSSVLSYSLLSAKFWLECLENALCAPLIFALLGLFPTLYVENSRERA